MITNTKITLSENELELVCNTEWILTKHVIIQKVYELFGDVLPLLESTVNKYRNDLPPEVFIHPPKISKGENYKLLPYVMLDYPRYFGKEDTLAIRTFFWWGNFFSVSLQVNGGFKTAIAEKLSKHFEWLQQNGYWLCIKDDPWEHHFESNNFIPFESITKSDFQTMLQRDLFVKIAKNIPVSKWQDAPVFIVKSFTDLAGLLKNDQAPKR